MNKIIRIIWTLLGGALAISGAVIIFTGTSQSSAANSAQASLAGAAAQESAIPAVDTREQSRGAQALLQDAPAPSPTPKAISLVLADIAPRIIEGSQSYSQEVIYQFQEQGDISRAMLGIHSHSEIEVYRYSEEEKIFIARVVYAEARGEIFEGQVAVATVVLNRFESGKFGSSVKRVVFARSQFAVSRKHSEQGMLAVEMAIQRRGDYPDNMFYFQASKRKTWRNFVYLERIGGHSFYCAASR